MDTEPLPTDLSTPRPSWRGTAAMIITGVCGVIAITVFIISITT